MNQILQMAMNRLVQSNPNIVGSPRNQALLNTLSSGNPDNIRQTALNLCQTYGCSVEEAGQMAMNWLNGQNRQ